jgi:hypothetical protein
MSVEGQAASSMAVRCQVVWVDAEESTLDRGGGTVSEGREGDRKDSGLELLSLLRDQEGKQQEKQAAWLKWTSCLMSIQRGVCYGCKMERWINDTDEYL